MDYGLQTCQGGAVELCLLMHQTVLLKPRKIISNKALVDCIIYTKCDVRVQERYYTIRWGHTNCMWANKRYSGQGDHQEAL